MKTCTRSTRDRRPHTDCIIGVCKDNARYDQGYGRGGTLVFTSVFEPLARVTLYLTDENGLGSGFGVA